MNEKELLGHRLKKARERLRFTQTEAASRLEIHNSTLGKYELGEREPDIETIKKIAEFYQVSPVWIIFGDEECKQGTDQEKIDLMEKEAAKLGLSPGDPAFSEMLLDALELLRLARGKNSQQS